MEAVDNPLAVPTLLKLAESKISHINGHLFLLGGLQYLPETKLNLSAGIWNQEESRRGWFDCGQLWKWLCAMKLWADHGRFEPPPAAFFTLPDRRRFSTRYSQDATTSLARQRRRTERVPRINLPPPTPPLFFFWGELQCWAPWKHVWCSCGARRVHLLVEIGH